MGVAEAWGRTPRKRKLGLLIFLAVVALVALCLGLAFGEETSFIPDNTLLESTNSECSSFLTENPNIQAEFFHEGLACNNCTELSDGVSVKLSECSNLCGEWTISGTNIDPLQNTCEEINIPPDLIGSGYICPEHTYITHRNTGCIADSIKDFKLLSELCIHLGDDTTLETCYDTCELIGDDCGGISVSADGLHCFVFTKAAHDICNNVVDNQNVCKPVKEEISCFDDQLTYAEAEAFCMAQGERLALRLDPDDFDAMLTRLFRSCEEANSTSCFFSGGDSDCRFVDNGVFNVDTNCNDRRGYCCESITDAPTVSPTESPTERLFFICEDEQGEILQTDFDSAEECCLERGGDLAAITSQVEQDFAFEICSNYITAQNGNGDCGCWIGVDRRGIVAVDQLDPDNFKYTDGSGPLTFSGFEQLPEVKPDNQDDRNEECVHMRPFSDGGWNDLPCDGNCDARDTKPVPLCRLRTPNPTSSPTENPTRNPTESPTFSPTNFPTSAPSPNPTINPTKHPTKSPTLNPTSNPTQSPTQNPTQNPTSNPTPNPTRNPTINPTKNPTQNPTQNPTANPTSNPTQNPTTNPTNNPTANPTSNPTLSPTRNPTKNPTRNPTGNPTHNPTANPTQNPTINPTINPTTSPTRNPTGNPSIRPTSSPTVNPTRNPTLSPTSFPTVNPTINPTFSPTINPTSNPTLNPTTNPTENPTNNPTANPTTNPTASPTQNPTKNPTSNPTNSPTPNPSANPTQNPTGNPTTNPTKNPTSSPTNNPTRNPTQNPTQNPTENPTANPTKLPTTSPTKNPTSSPTYSPIKHPDPPLPCCHYAREEYVWKFTNPNDKTAIPFIWFFKNFPKKIVEPTLFYGRCEFSICIGFPQTLLPGETYEFRSPTSAIIVEYPCDQNNPADLCRFNVEAPESLFECVCDNVEFFSDDFEVYPTALGITVAESPEFFDIYSVPIGTVDIKGPLLDSDGNIVLDDEGEPLFVSGFFFNPCLGTHCVDVDGTLEVQPEEVTLGLREVAVGPSDAFFNRICTLNFQVRGNGRCGSLHVPLGITNRAEAIEAGCFQFSRTTFVPLFDNLTASISEGGATIVSELFENIEWDQDYLPYGVTADVNNQQTSVGAAFTVDGGSGSDNLGGNIGPLIDNIDLTCCCPEENARYIGTIIAVDQGTAFNGLLVPSTKSNFIGLIGHEANYFRPFTYALGLAGSITIKFDLGVTGVIRIYEESYLCCGGYDPEDARVEVSIDGIHFLPVAQSLKGEYNKVMSEQGDHIRYVDVALPNGACFKYVKLIDTSDVDAAHCDGFDLVSVEVLHPCCPTAYPDIDTPSPTLTPGVTSSSFAFGGEATSIGLVAYIVAALATGLFLMLVSLSLWNERQLRKEGDIQVNQDMEEQRQEEVVSNKEI